MRVIVIRLCFVLFIFAIVISFCMSILGMGLVLYLGMCMIHFVREWGVIFVYS